VEWSSGDPHYQEAIALLCIKGLHLSMWHLHLPFLPMPYHIP
jgi:hypothetical protein